MKRIALRMLSIVISFLMIFYLLPMSVYADFIDQIGSSSETEETDTTDTEEDLLKDIFEVTDRREESVKHFRLEDGSYVAVQYDVPVHYLDESGEWRDIDNTLSASGNEYSTSNAKIKFAKKITGNETLFTLHDGNRKITMSLDGALKKTAGQVTNTSTEFDESATKLQKMMTLDKLSSRILYADILDGVDLEYVVESLNIKENIFVKEKKDSYSYTFTIKLNNLEAELNDDGSVSIYDPDSEEIVYTIPAPVVYDSANNYAGADDAGFSLVKSGNNTYSLTVAADAEWMNSDDRVFPVTVDPAIYVGSTSSMTDTYVDSDNPNSVYYSFTYLAAGHGSSGQEFISYWMPSELPSIPDNAYITSSTIELYCQDYRNHTTAYSHLTVGAYKVTSSWSSGATWSTVSGGTKGAYSTMLDYAVLNILSEGDYISWDITSLVKEWYDGTASNYGVAFQSMEDYNIDALFTSENASSNRPRLMINYRDMKGLESYWSFTSQNAGLAGTGYVNNATGNLVFSVGTLTTTDGLFGFTPTLTYNSAMAGEYNTYTYNSNVPYKYSAAGYGWKLNMNETVVWRTFKNADGEDVTYYIYSDSDGTEHYFTPNSYGVYKDEDGLGLTLINSISGNFIEIEDESHTVRHFTKTANSSYIYEGAILDYIQDSCGNKIQFNYNNSYGRVSSIGITPNGSTQITYFTLSHNASGCLYKITNSSSGQSVTLEYSITYNGTTSTSNSGYLRKIVYSHTADGGTVTDATVSYTYSAAGKLIAAWDQLSNSTIVYNYTSDKIRTVSETTTDPVGTAISGQSIGFTYGNGYTEIRSSGTDDIYGTSDDIITHYTFDNAGRVSNAYSTDYTRSKIYGASSGTYDEGEMSVNSIKTSAVVGGSAANYLLNGGFEMSGNGTVPYWIASTSDINKISLDSLGEDPAFKQVWFVPQPNTELSITQYVRLPNGEYTLSFDYNAMGCDDVEVSIVVDSISVSGRSYGKQLSVSREYATNNSYESVSFTANGTSGTEAFKISFVVKGGSGATDSSFVTADNFMLEENIGSSGYNMVQMGAFEYSAINSSNSVQYYPGSVWLYEGSGYSYYTDTSLFGQSIKLNGAIGSTQNVYQTIYTGDASERSNYERGFAYKTLSGMFTVSGFAKGTGQVLNSDSIFRITAEVYYYNEIMPRMFNFDFEPSNNDWQFVSGSFEVGAGSDKGKFVEKIIVRCEYSNQPGEAYFDNINVTQATGGNVVSYEYNAAGKVSKKTTPNYYETYVYNSYSGDLEQVENSTGYAYIYQYNSNHTISYEAYQVLSGNLLIKQTETEYIYNSYGLNTEIYTCVTSYADKDDMVGETSKKLTSTTAYNTTAGSKIFGKVTQTTNSAGQTTKYTYDTNKGRLLYEVSPDFYSGLYYTYDGMGRMTNVRPLDFDDIEQIYIPQTDAESVTYTYDTRNQISSIATETTTYYFVYDSYGNVLTIGTTGGVLATYTYNSYNGKLKTMQYSNGTTVRYVYDELDRVSELWYTEGTDSEALRYKYAYTSNGQISRIEDYKTGRNYLYKYGADGKLISYVEYDSTGMINILGADFVYNDKSELTEAEFGFDYTYGGSNVTYGTVRYNYTYNPDGTVSAVDIYGESNLSGDVLNTYDALGRLGSKVYIYGSYTYTNTVSYTYKDRNTTNTTTQVSTYSTQVNSNTATTYTYTYDSKGNITKITDNSGNITKYTYDDLSQLIREDNPYTNESYKYTYDNNGNRTKKETYAYTTGTLGTATSTENYTYGNSSWGDQLTKVGTTSITYDAIGNPLTYGDTFYVWESGRRLKEVRANLGVSVYKYEYNDEGIRTSKTISGVKHTYTLNGSQIFSEAWGNHFIIYLYDETGSPIGMQYRTKSMGEGEFYTYLFEKNLQGDIIAVYNTSGTKLVSYVYDAWGNCTVTNHNITGTNVGARYNPFRYRGYYLDTETGYYYLQSRYYNPQWGRFLNADGQLSDDLLGCNLYVYCYNNPVMLLDYNGDWPTLSQILSATTIIAIGAISVAAIVCSAGAASAAIGMGIAMYIGASATTAATITTVATVGCYVVAAGVGMCAVSNAGEVLTGTNVVRDYVLGGNQQAYDFLQMGLSIASAGIVNLASDNPTLKPSKSMIVS